jgi:hypothetical protein
MRSCVKTTAAARGVVESPTDCGGRYEPYLSASTGDPNPGGPYLVGRLLSPAI